MKSNVCKIENGVKDLDAILRESEKVAIYNELTHKQALQLRLICEEIDGMLPNIIDSFNGDLWIEFENGVCKVNISLCFDKFTAEKKNDLISIAKNKKNAAAVGIVGKIRSILENVFLDEDNFAVTPLSTETRYMLGEYCDPCEYPCIWSLDNYRNTVNDKKTSAEWDELEKSVIATVADDVIIGVKGKRAEIVIIKKFA